MISWATLAAFSAASVLLILLPGPSLLFIVGRSVAYGRTAGVLSVVGNALGMIPAIVAVAFGLGAIVAQSVVLFTIIKIIGAGYLIYLAVQTIRHRNIDLGDTPDATVPLAKGKILREAFVVGITNPKTIAFFVAVLPQFVDRTAGAVWLQLLTLGLIFFGLALLFDSLWAVLAGTARDWFATSPHRIRNMRTTGGVMMLGLAGTLLFTGSKA